MRLLVLLCMTLLLCSGWLPSAQAFNPFPDQDIDGYKNMFRDGQRSRTERSETEEEDDDDEDEEDTANKTRFPEVLTGGPKPRIKPIAPKTVVFTEEYGKGSIVIDTRGRQLFYVLGGGNAYRYPISVGRRGFQWAGTNKISRIASWPDWRPPAEMRKRKPHLPKLMKGGVRNPLGAKALYLGSTLYRIHGTNNVRSIGIAASSGCFRMLNGHVIHLAKRAKIGTRVHVLKRLPKSVAKRVSRQAGSAKAAAREAAGI